MAPFAVILSGAPGSGKTVCLEALSDALIHDEIAHAAIDVDEVAWAYPYPDNAGRLERLRALWESHRSAGHDLLLVVEVVEAPAHLDDVLASVGADDHLLVRLEASPAALRERILAREQPGWAGLEYLLDYTERMLSSIASVEAHLAFDTESFAPHEIAERIRAARPDVLGPPG